MVPLPLSIGVRRPWPKFSVGTRAPFVQAVRGRRASRRSAQFDRPTLGQPQQPHVLDTRAVSTRRPTARDWLVLPLEGGDDGGYVSTVTGVATGSNVGSVTSPEGRRSTWRSLLGRTGTSQGRRVGEQEGNRVVD